MGAIRQLQWVEAVDRVIMSGLAMPIELSDDSVVRSYNAWLEQHYLEPLRSVCPDRYRSVIEQNSIVYFEFRG